MLIRICRNARINRYNYMQTQTHKDTYRVFGPHVMRVNLPYKSRTAKNENQAKYFPFSTTIFCFTLFLHIRANELINQLQLQWQTRDSLYLFSQK